MFPNATPSRIRFTIGGALTAAFDAIGANLGPMAVLALAVVGVPQLLVRLAMPPAAVAVAAAQPFAQSPASLVLLAVNFITGVLLEGAVTLIVITYLNGRRPRIGESLARVGPIFLPLIGIALTIGVAAFLIIIATIIPLIVIVAFTSRGMVTDPSLGVLVGLSAVLVAIIPMLFVVIMWAVAAPVQVVERRGVIGSLSRSAELTARHRWAILAVLAVMALIGGAVGMVGFGLSALANMLLISLGAFAGFPKLFVSSLVTAAVSSLGAMFGAAGRAGIYFELRRAKEGASPESLGSVFD